MKKKNKTIRKKRNRIFIKKVVKKSSKKRKKIVKELNEVHQKQKVLTRFQVLTQQAHKKKIEIDKKKEKVKEKVLSGLKFIGCVAGAMLSTMFF